MVADPVKIKGKELVQNGSFRKSVLASSPLQIMDLVFLTKGPCRASPSCPSRGRS